ncbi:BCCT family transporter [Zhihengliuella alba]|uniref:BCCT family transporter n=1 Tax=Zhihengliuella alba TaxID=547018 RepID=A0ABP7DHJ0_9MICC
MAAETSTRPNIGQGRARILKPVFIPASIIIFALLAFTVIFSRSAGDQIEEATTALNAAISDGVGWWYVLVVNVFLIFAVYFAASKIGRIRLGRDDEQPEFGIASWFMMLFSAGMGIGLVFFSVAEPLSHYITPPYGIEGESTEATQGSLGTVMLHWGLHPWGIYAIVGLGLAYMTFRRGRPLAVRWLLEPLLGRQRVEGWIGHAIDTIAVVGTLFGVATSFGFGVSQIVGGLEFLGWAENSTWLIIAIIGGITLIATWSVVSGVHKGLKWLSNINMSIAAMLALVVFILGPTIFLLKAFPENIGNYISILPESMFHAGPFSEDGWEKAWTIFYWGWWVSWAPFVGMFIARISRGRTIREFIVGVLLAPTVASLVWFTIFGDTAIKFQREGTVDMLVDGAVSSTTALFQFLSAFPLATVLSVVAMLVVVFFFVTSSDSGSLVIDMLASGGSTNTPVSTRMYWALLEGLAAAVLLIAGGSVALTALQTLSIATAAPFSIIMVLTCVSLLRAFRHDVANMPNYMQVIPAHENGSPPEQTAEGPVDQNGHPFRGIGGTSAALSGFAVGPRTAAEEAAAHEPQIISFRHVEPGATSVDPETGAIQVLSEPKDPLAGEVFDTPEFESSQEYLDQGGVPLHDEAEAEDEPGAGGSRGRHADADPTEAGR